MATYDKYINDPVYGLQSLLGNTGTFAGYDEQGNPIITRGDEGRAWDGSGYLDFMSGYNPGSQYATDLYGQNKLAFVDGLDRYQTGAQQYGLPDAKSFIEKYQGGGQWETDKFGNPIFTPSSGQLNAFPDIKVEDDGIGGFLKSPVFGVMLAGLGGIGAAEGLFGGLSGATGGTGALPESYWSALADAGGGVTATDAAAAGAGSVGTGATGGGMDLFDLWNLGTDETLGGIAADELAGGFYGGTGGAGFEGLGTDETLGGLPSSEVAGGGSGFDFSSLLNNRNLLSALLGSGGQALSSYLASRAQQNAAGQATNALLSMYNQNRADLAPWRNAGATAVGQLTDLTTPGKQFNEMSRDPGYMDRLKVGRTALDNQLRAAGKFYSGPAIKAGIEYNQNFASNEFNNVYNRLAGLAGTGQTAANTTAQLGQNTAAGQASNLTGAGNARASGYVGLGNALQGGLANYQQNEMLDQLLPMLARRYG